MLSIIKNEARAFYRDILAVFFCLIFPSLIVFLLGTFLETVDKSDKTVGELNIAYSVSESGEPVEEYINALIEKGIITAEKTDGDESFADKIKNSDIASAILEKDEEITIFRGNNLNKSRAIAALFDGYAVNADAYKAAYMSNPSLLSEIEVPDVEMVHCDGLSKRSMMDYYAVTMLVMILFVGSAICSASSYHRERKNLTLNRISIAPISAGKVYFGKVIGSLLSGVIQSGMVMLTSVLLFGAHYCDSLSGNLLLIAMLFCVLLLVNALGMLLGVIFTKISLTPVLIGVFWLALFFSGVFAREIYVPGFSDMIPTYKVQQASFDLTMFGRGDKAITVIAVSLGLVLLFALLGALKVRFGRKSV